ncbi:MAG: galactokinase [Candidatus Sulfotelmatobacter sp.]
MPAENLRSEFEKRFGTSCTIFRAPGRVNLIGEHTDYNDGYVMPAAISFDTFAACAGNESGNLSVQSLQDPQAATFPVHEAKPQPAHNWTDYVRGVLIQLENEGLNIPGANLLIDGQVPIGAGLSSSAALEVATALALLSFSKHSMDSTTIAQFCQRAENEFVGSRCGIMDQFASLHGRAENALLLDCRSLDTRLLPLPENVSLVICNTMVKHSVAHGEYNVRRAECEAGVRYFAQYRKTVNALRDVTEDDLRQFGSGLSDVLLRRCRHVVTENARVLAASRALESGDLKRFGQLMYESHRSLKDDFEVSCSELDIMVELARKLPGVHGARMTGGGFGGCTINLVERSEARAFSAQIIDAYQHATQIRPEVYITHAAPGAGPAIE